MKPLLIRLRDNTGIIHMINPSFVQYVAPHRADPTGLIVIKMDVTYAITIKLAVWNKIKEDFEIKGLTK